MGFTINPSDFHRATKSLEDTARKNTATYGRALARQFEQTAKTGAPWTDRRGNARGKLYGASEASGSRVYVQMGGLAPNYKRSRLSAKDYMEYLEFANKGKYAIIVPTTEAIAEDVAENFGNAALNGKMRFNIKRNYKDLNRRRKSLLEAVAEGRAQIDTRRYQPRLDAMRYQMWLKQRAYNRRAF